MLRIVIDLRKQVCVDSEPAHVLISDCYTQEEFVALHEHMIRRCDVAFICHSYTHPNLEETATFLEAVRRTKDLDCEKVIPAFVVVCLSQFPHRWLTHLGVQGGPE